MTPAQAREVIQSRPFTLSTGQSLQDWLARETSLGPNRGPMAVREYQRCLALALSAAPGEISVPGPMISHISRIHRDDSFAYGTFLADLDTHRRAHRSHRISPDATLSHRRYAMAFGTPYPAYCPSCRAWIIPPKQRLFELLLALPFILGGLLWLKDNRLDGVIIPALLLAAAFIISAPLRRALTATDFRVFRPTPTSFAQGPS